MAADLKKTLTDALASLPSQEDIRRRIAENLQERQLLRKLLRLAEQRQQTATIGKTEGRSRG
jgi:hypothetical protein